MADVDNIKIAEQFNKLFSERRVLASAVTREMRNQLELATQLATIVGGMKPEEIADKLSAATKVLDELKEKAKEAGGQSGKAMDAVTTGAKGAAKGTSEADKRMKVLTQKFPALKSVAAGAFNGLIQGFKNIIAFGTTGIGMLSGFAGGVFKIAKSIAAIPLKIFRGMIDLANDFSGDTSFLQALENLRKEFGNFKEDMSKNVLGAFKTAQAGITGTGLSTFRVLGTFAQQLEYFTEIAKQAGPQFHEFGKSIADEAGKFVAFEKGLGIGADHVKAFLDRAKEMGTTWQTEFGKTANYTLQMGKAFGMSQKVIGKDIAQMMKDVKNFGSLTQKEMSVASVYTRKLGIEVKSLTGLIDKFDTFEDAANSAAQMSQAFGTSVDAFKLMQEQDPAKRMDMLRKSMQAAGKTTENMSRQELKLLAQTSGLDEATAKLAFSAKNQGVSYDQVKKKAEEAERAPIRQAEALEKLAASIERVVMQGQNFKGGFIEQFLHGFGIGVKSSHAFRNAIMTLRMALRQTMYAGIAVGKMFVHTFGGGSLENILHGIVDVFKDWDSVMDRVKVAFQEFFVDLDVRKLIDRFKNIFLGHFSAKGSAGSQMVEGIKNTFKAFVTVIAGGGKYMIEELTKGLKKVGDAIKKYLKDPKSFWEGFDKATDNAQAGFLGMIKPLINLARDEKLWNDLFGALTNAFEGVWELVKKWIKGPTFQKMIGKILPMMFGMLVVPSVLRGAAGGAASTIFDIFKESMKNQAQASAKGGKDGSPPIPASSLLGNPYVLAAAAIAAAGVAGTGMSKGMDKFYGNLEKDVTIKGDKLDKKVGASVAGIVQMLSFGTLSDEASGEMSKNFTEFSNAVSMQIDSIFGPAWAKKIRVDIENRLDFLVNFGGFLRSLISGDVEGAAKSFFAMFQNLHAIIIGNLRTVFLDIPNKIIEFISLGIARLSKWIEDTMASDDAPTSIWKSIKPFLTNMWTHMLGPLLHSFGTLFLTLVTKLAPAIAGLGWTLTKLFLRAFISAGEALFKLVFGGFIDATFGKGFTAEMIKAGENNARNFWNGLMDWLKVNGPKKLQKLFQSMKISVPPPVDTSRAGAGATDGSPIELVPMETELPEIVPVAPLSDAASEKMYQAQQTLAGMEAMQKLEKMDVQKTIDNVTTKLQKLDMTKLNEDLMNRLVSGSKQISDFATAFGTQTTQAEARLAPVLKATQDIIASVKELDSILASGDATRISVSKKLTKLANNAGLGGNDKYTIQNKGVQINLDLKVVMNAEELEEALVLRSKSIIKESVKKTLGITDDTLRDRLRHR